MYFSLNEMCSTLAYKLKTRLRIGKWHKSLKHNLRIFK